MHHWVLERLENSFEIGILKYGNPISLTAARLRLFYQGKKTKKMPTMGTLCMYGLNGFDPASDKLFLRIREYALSTPNKKAITKNS